MKAVLLTALPVEYRAVRRHIIDICEDVHNGTVYERGLFKSGIDTWDVMIAEVGPGNTSAAREAERVMEYFNPSVVLFVGIAGGLKDVSLGDVVAATKVYGYESGKASEIFLPRPDLGISAYRLVQRARAEARRSDWLKRLNEPVPDPPPKVLIAPIAAGDKVVASTRSDIYRFLREQYSDGVAVEMEGKGFLDAVHAYPHAEGLVIRGISDLVDQKLETDQIGYQDIAAGRASAFAFEILAKLAATEKIEWVMVITGTFEAVDKPIVEAIVEHLRELSGDTKLTLKRLMHGSIILVMDSTSSGFKIIKDMFDSGRLNAINGFKIEEIYLPSESPKLSITQQENQVAFDAIPLSHLEVLNRSKKKVANILWNMPYERNPYFTGRDKAIQDLRDAILRDKVGALSQAISGLGGVGKTQIAVEYTYRYRDQYKAVFWTKAESDFNLQSSFFEIARTLGLPEKDAQEANVVVDAVKRWLEANSDWLLIFDNADNPSLIRPYRPFNASGHVLLTSRSQVFQSLGIAKPIEIYELLPEEAMEFLFKRTWRENDDASEDSAAKELVRELGCFPLALEQAGAYITQNKVRFQDYLASYRKRHLELLAESRPVAGDYHESVATTWSFNFSEVKKASEESADLLCLSAFLNADNIPLELIAKVASHLGHSLSSAPGKAKEDMLAVNAALEPLTRYSLVHRDIKAHTYSLHRLVQEVLKSEMDKETLRLWAERTINTISAAFPEPEFANWAFCDRLLPHGLSAAVLVDEFDFDTQEAAFLLNQLGVYLKERANYAEAEQVYRKSLAIYEKVLGTEHPFIATSLNNLAENYCAQGKYSIAESLFQKSLAMREKELGKEHLAVANTLNNLAGAYRNQGKYIEADSLYQRSLAIREKSLGPEHDDVATVLNNLGSLYNHQGKLKEAEQLLKRALAIWEKELGVEHPRMATSLNNLASLYKNQEKYAEAESLYLKSLAVLEKTHGTEHPDIASNFDNLAEIYTAQGKYTEAESLLKRALLIRENMLGTEHPQIAISLNNLGYLYYKEGKYSEAERLYQRSLAIREKVNGPEHPDVAQSLGNLALLYNDQGKYVDAEAFYKKSIALYEKVPGSQNLTFATNLNNLAVLYNNGKKYAEAEALYKRALIIRDKALGPEHPEVARILNNLGAVYHYQRRFREAELTHKRALAIREKMLGKEHPEVAQSLNNLAALYNIQGKHIEAKKLQSRGEAIMKKHKKTP